LAAVLILAEKFSDCPKNIAFPDQGRGLSHPPVPPHSYAYVDAWDRSSLVICWPTGHCLAKNFYGDKATSVTWYSFWLLKPCPHWRL